MRAIRRTLVLAAPVAAILALGACAVVPYGADPYYGGAYVNVAPAVVVPGPAAHPHRGWAPRPHPRHWRRW